MDVSVLHFKKKKSLFILALLVRELPFRVHLVAMPQRVVLQLTITGGVPAERVTGKGMLG